MRALAKRGVPFVVADENREVIEKLRERNIPAVVGDASTAMVLAQAHVARAAVLIIATPDTMKVRQIVETARALNPGIHVIIRSHSEMEASLLEKEEAGDVFVGERELANSITQHVLKKLSEETD